MFSLNLKLNLPWFRQEEKSCLGIDIGTSAIKIIELSKKEEKIILQNYAEVKSNLIFKDVYTNQFNKTNFNFPPLKVSDIIKIALKKAKIKTKKVIFSLADFSTFFTTIELPQMSKDEISSAIYFAAKQYVPISLKEMVLDWTILSPYEEKQKNKLKILLVVIPKDIIDRYKKIAKNSQLQLLGIEAEIFALIKAVERFLNQEPIILLDIGARSTIISIIENKALKISYSFQFSSFELINLVVKKLVIEPEKAEELIKTQGLKNYQLKDTLSFFIDRLIKKIELVLKNFEEKQNKKISKIFISGGTSSLKGLNTYLSQSLKREVTLLNPFSNFSYPASLEPVLEEMAPSFAIAVGSALQALEYELKNK